MREIVVFKKKYLSKKTCDICKKENDGYDDVTIEIKSGDWWPEIDCRTVITYDICNKCFESFVMPHLKQLGLTKYSYEVDSGEETRKIID